MIILNLQLKFLFNFIIVLNLIYFQIVNKFIVLIFKFFVNNENKMSIIIIKNLHKLR
jgi:hypothetical protein